MLILLTGRVAALNKDKNEVHHFLRSPVLSMKLWVGRHVACAHNYVSKRISTVADILRIVKNERHGILSSQFVLGDSPLVLGCVVPSRKTTFLF